MIVLPIHTVCFLIASTLCYLTRHALCHGTKWQRLRSVEHPRVWIGRGTHEDFQELSVRCKKIKGRRSRYRDQGNACSGKTSSMRRLAASGQKKKEERRGWLEQSDRAGPIESAIFTEEHVRKPVWLLRVDPRAKLDTFLVRATSASPCQKWSF